MGWRAGVDSSGTFTDVCSEIACFGHGGTVATNSPIELRVARTGLVTTDGFRDLLEIGRQRRPHLCDMQTSPERSFPGTWGWKRRRVDGSVETPLDLAAVHDAAMKRADKGAASVAVCFLQRRQPAIVSRETIARPRAPARPGRRNHVAFTSASS